MVKLEARFHPPDRRGSPYIVVGHIVWPEAHQEARIELSPMLALAPAPATILATLRHLVRRLSSRERLESLRTEHWSFVDVQSVGRNA